MRAFQAGVSKAGRWIVVAGVVGAVGAATASAGSQPSRRPSAAVTERVVAGLRAPAFGARAKAKKPKLGGVVLGGVDSKSGFAHILQVNRKLTRVQGWAGIELTCTSGATPDLPDSFPKLKLSKAGKFAAATPALPIDTGDPKVTATLQDSVSGKINARHTKATLVWHLIITITDSTTGTPKVDTCDSGPVSWSAVQ
ncbi:MAG TPA: hypothetical protein VH418_14975 [Solirubrobacteraceae bacterium]|jgi:hypothetical protein